jgi:hypothetical protein
MSRRPRTSCAGCGSTREKLRKLRSPFLLPRLLGEPFVEHGAREADVPADPVAGQAAGPHGLVDPARPDVEIPSGLIWPKQPILLQRSLCCWCCCFHAGIDPNAAEPANGFLPPNARPPRHLACQQGQRRRPKNEPRRPPDDRWGTMQGTMPCRRNLVIGLLLLRLQVFWKWARRDSNPRPTDYESAALTS